jgi:hypothetical protein
MVTLELRMPRSAEQTAAAMVQVLNALPNPLNGLLSRWKSAPTFYFEIASYEQMVRFQVVVPAPHRDYLMGQLTAVYPEILIHPVALPNSGDNFGSEGLLQVSCLELARPNHYPLQTYETLGASEGDPLSALLSALSQLREGESALLQLAIAKAREDWKETALKALDNAREAPSVEATFEALARRKLAAPGFRFALNLVIRAPTPKRLCDLERQLREAFNVFQSPVNRLEGGRIWCSSRHLTNVLARRVKPRQQVLCSHELATLFHLPNRSLATIRNLAWGKRLPGEPPANLPTYAATPLAKRQMLNVMAQVEFKNKPHIFGLRREDRRRHLYVVGKTGVGKSTLLANMIINDLKHDEGLAVIDPHGDLVETVLDYIPRRRINDTIVLDPSDPEAVVQLNLFDGGSVVHRELIASGLVAMFHKLYGHSWGPRLEHILRNALLTLLSRQARLEDITRLLTSDSYRQRVIDQLTDPVLHAFWTQEFEPMHERQRTEAIAPILNKVGQFVSSPLVRRVANARTSSIDIEQIMDRGQILLVNVSQGKLGEDNAALLGAMLITRLQLAAMNRAYLPEAERRDFFLYIDEFQNFATTSFIKILSEARKYRLNLTLANQYIAQVPEEVRAAIFGNAGNLLSFTVGAEDAGLLSREFSKLYTPGDLTELTRHQAIAKLMIDGEVARPFPAQTLPLANSHNQNREKVLRVSRERYARKGC